MMEVIFTTKAQSTQREDAIALTNIIARQLVDKETKASKIIN